MTNQIKHLQLLDEYLPEIEDVGTIDAKNRIIIPKYYREKTKTRLEYRNFPPASFNRFALVAIGDSVSVLDALVYELEASKLRKDGLSAIDVSYDNTGRIIIPRKISEDVFNSSKKILFRPSDDNMYFTMNSYKS